MVEAWMCHSSWAIQSHSHFFLTVEAMFLPALSVSPYLKPGLSFFPFFEHYLLISSTSYMTYSAPNNFRSAHICHHKWPISHFSFFCFFTSFPPPSATFLLLSLPSKSQVAVIKTQHAQTTVKNPFQWLFLFLSLVRSLISPSSGLLVDIVMEYNCQAALITAEFSLFLSAHFVNDWAVLNKSPSEIHF